MTPNRKPRSGGNRREALNQQVWSSSGKIAETSAKVNNSAPLAAVYGEKDPRSAKVARVVPRNAKIIKIGDATLGYRAEGASKFRPLTWLQVVAYQRRNELHRLVSYRVKRRLDIGSAFGWAKVVADLVAALGEPVTYESISNTWKWIAGDSHEIDRDIIDLMARDTEIARRVWDQYRLFPAREAGAAIALTEIEREDCGILRIDAWTEPSADRSRRLARERKRKERERKRNDVTLTYNIDNNRG
ncbi:hypothetical protein [Rhizobium rhizogenes]|uniref:hypothetical protein n=1 Tax=Rhizobium rhizogenes TaxID=359 RepID=UPI00157278BD|nr:hypothetical protein [Rhizobium rhizogenes]NTF80874.1 hypothetical protein [Rhizobium rhizogenes]